jgi:pimeloyl-ACP methyl ester carboxylesterase
MEQSAPWFPFRSAASRDLCMRLYDEGLAPLGEAREERDVSTSFGRAHVVSVGPTGGEPLVLLHGASASASVLRNEIAAYVREGFRVHAPDIPGHAGRSEPRTLSYFDDSSGRWLAEVMGALGIARASLIGYSLGGLVAIRMAQHAPDRIARAVIVVPGGLSRPTPSRAVPIMMNLILYRITGNAKWRRKMALRMCARGTAPDDYVVECVDLMIEHLYPDRKMLPVLRADELAEVRVPILVCPGEHDPLFDWRATASAARAMPAATVEKIDNCGHLIDLDSLERFRARSTAFLRVRDAHH